MQAVIDASPGEILERARADGRRSLSDEEAFALAQSLGFGVPAFQHVALREQRAESMIVSGSRNAGVRSVLHVARAFS